MRRREAESIVDDIINELRYMPIFEEDFEHLEKLNRNSVFILQSSNNYKSLWTLLNINSRDWRYSVIL